jgi:hypothetical protein
MGMLKIGRTVGVRRRGTVEAAPPDESALGTVAALAAKPSESTVEERAALRTGIIQQLRTAFAEIVFRSHAIVGLIDCPRVLLRTPFWTGVFYRRNTGAISSPSIFR